MYESNPCVWQGYYGGSRKAKTLEGTLLKRKKVDLSAVPLGVMMAYGRKMSCGCRQTDAYDVRCPSSALTSVPVACNVRQSCHWKQWLLSWLGNMSV